MTDHPEKKDRKEGKGAVVDAMKQMAEALSPGAGKTESVPVDDGAAKKKPESKDKSPSHKTGAGDMKNNTVGLEVAMGKIPEELAAVVSEAKGSQLGMVVAEGIIEAGGSQDASRIARSIVGQIERAVNDGTLIYTGKTRDIARKLAEEAKDLGLIWNLEGAGAGGGGGGPTGGVPKEFKDLVDSSGAIPVGLEKFAADWKRRIQLVESGRSSYETQFNIKSLFEDAKELDRLSRRDDIKRDEAVAWSNTIAEYLAKYEQARQPVFSIRPDEVKDAATFGTDAFTLGHYWDLHEVDLLREEKGEYKYLLSYVWEKIVIPRSDSRESLIDQQKINDLDRFLVWKYGPEDGNRIKNYYKDIRTNMEGAHHKNRSLTMEGLGAEELFKVFRQAIPEEFDFFNSFRHIEHAFQIYENVVLKNLSVKRNKWVEVRDGNVAKGILPQRSDNPHVLTREKRIKDIDILLNGSTGTPQQRSQWEFEKEELVDQDNLYAQGVSLWADEWNFMAKDYYAALDKNTETKQLMYKSKMALADNKTLLPAEQARLDELLKDRTEVVRLEAKQTTGALTPEETKRLGKLKTALVREEMLLQNEGFSELETEVHEQLKQYLDVKGISHNEQELKTAILMARYHLVYSQHIVSIVSFMTVPPDITPHSGAYGIMKGPIFEDFVRFYNWEQFFTRFGMGSDAGKVALAHFNREQAKIKGRQINVVGSSLWKKLTETAKEHPERMVELEAIATWERESGISFAAILNNQLHKAGGRYDASGWRAAIGIFDKSREMLRDKIAEIRIQNPGASTDALLSNLALSFQFAAESPTSPEGLANRERIFNKQLLRDPLLFMHYMADERANLLTDARFANVNFELLASALSLTQCDLTTITEFQIAPDINLGGMRDFNRLVAPYLQRLGVAPGANLEEYRRFMEVMQEMAQSKKDYFLKVDFPLTLRIGDLDWKNGTLFQGIGTLADVRRVRDQEGAYNANSNSREFLAKPQLLFNPDPTKVLEHLYTKIVEPMIGHTGYDQAELVGKALLATYFDMNENKIRRTFGWLPFSEKLFRFAADIDPHIFVTMIDKLPDRLYGRGNTPAKIEARKERKDRAKKFIESRPTSVGRMLSHAVEFTGASAPAFDEKVIADTIHTAQTMGMFLKNKKFAHDLMRQFKSTPSWMMLRSVRRYWWLILSGLAGIALMTSMEDEKKH